jgi:phage portal protein BeeE
LIEAAISAPGTLTYANVIQRNLQFLIMNLQPAIHRRERTLSRLIPQQRFVKLNSDALLRMDPLTQAMVIHQRIADRTMTVTEARQKYDLGPLTAEQEGEFNRLFPPKSTSTTPAARSLQDWLVDDLAPRSPLPIGASS